MLGNFGNMMKQVQQAQKKAAKLQEELAEARFNSSTGGGLVTCEVDGLGTILSIKIDGAKLGLDPEDAEMLQESVMGAVQEATKAAQDASHDKMDDLTGGLPIPPGFGL